MKITPLDDWICVKAGTCDNHSLRAYQLEKLRETIWYAKKRSRHYRENLPDNVTDRIMDLNDIADIGFTTP